MPRCSWSSTTRNGSTVRPRTCSRSWLGESSPTRSSCWPPFVTATPRCSLMPGCRSTGSAASTTRRPQRCSTRRLRAFRSRARSRVLREAAGNPLALLELPTVVGQTRTSSAGRRRAADRAPRACVRRPRVRSARRALALVLLVAALNDEDAVGEILQAASAVAGTTLDLDVARAGRRGGGSSTSTCRRSASGIRSFARRSRRARA